MKEGDVILTPVPQADGKVKTDRLSSCAKCRLSEMP